MRKETALPLAQKLANIFDTSAIVYKCNGRYCVSLNWDKTTLIFPECVKELSFFPRQEVI